MYAPLCSLQQLFTIAEIGKQHKVCIDGWMDKDDAVKIQWTTTQPWKEILPFETTWMDFEGVMLSGISQVAKNRYHMSWNESEVAQSCPTLCNPMDRSLPRSSVHGILQARVLEWEAISFSRGSSPPRDQTQVSCIVGLSHQGSPYVLTHMYNFKNQSKLTKKIKANS